MTSFELGILIVFAVLIFCTLIAWNVFLWRDDITTRATRKRQRLIRKVDAALRANRDE